MFEQVCQITCFFVILLYNDKKGGVIMAIINNKKILDEVDKRLPSMLEKTENHLIYDPFYQDFAYRFCWSSNAIEGNSLSLDETISVVAYDEVKGGHSFTEYQEAKMLYSTIEKMLDRETVSITKEWLQSTNAMITGIEGKYRQKNLYIGTLVEATYYPPDYEKVPELMEAFLQSVNFKSDDKKEVIQVIAEQHIEFERIHPYIDGNGRTGRMLLNQQMINNGLLPVIIEKQSKYRQAFKAYDKNKDTSLMIHLISKGELDAMERINQLFEKLEHRMTEPKKLPKK